MANMSLKLPDRLIAKLEALATRRHTSKSDIVRSALEAYLDGARATSKASFLELAADLVGCVEGPSDLSHASRHMTGYGR